MSADSIVLPDGFLHRMIDDITAIVALCCLIRHQSTDSVLLAHVAHLEVIAREQAGRIQSQRREQSTAAVVAAVNGLRGACRHAEESPARKPR